MKSTKNLEKIVVFIFALFSSLVYSQYNGGIADGNSSQQITNLTCGLAPGQFAYTGGVSDGSSANTKIYTTCGLAPGAYAYAGGIGDGQGLETKSYINCPDPPQFYTYYGGSGDGSSMMKIQNCAIVLPIAEFSGTPTSICAGQNVTFTDASTNAVAWEWTVTGGTFVSPSTMYSQNPVVKYSTAGTYSVTLKARNIDGDHILTKTAYITVNSLATVASTTPGSRCGTGSVTIGATPNSGTINWYSAATGGTLLGTGTTWNTPSISTTTTYYAEANNGCISATRTAVIATVNPIPTITANNASRCGTGTVTISANPSTGTVKWYDAATGGTELDTGNSYTTPSISATTTYYAETTSAAGCPSGRIAVTATVNEIPTITSTTPATRCGSGTATISAVASAGSINWYDSLTGGSWLASGSSFSPSVNGTTTYYVGTTSSAGCSSARTAVTITVNTVPTITSTTPASRCGTGTVTLEATASGGTISWYANATGGTALATGTSYTTPSISSSTTYYVETDNGTCKSGRTAITATVNNTAAPTGNSTQTFCSGETVGALLTSGLNIQWYDTATGGNLLSNTTQLVNGTTYYATQTVNSCESTGRLAVTAVQGTCLGTVDQVKSNFKVYPIPVADLLSIDSDDEITKIELYAASGQKILERKVNAKKFQLNVQDLPQALYILKVLTIKETKAVKVIKK